MVKCVTEPHNLLLTCCIKNHLLNGLDAIDPAKPTATTNNSTKDFNACKIYL